MENLSDFIWKAKADIGVSDNLIQIPQLSHYDNFIFYFYFIPGGKYPIQCKELSNLTAWMVVNDSEYNFYFIPGVVYPTQYGEFSNLTASMIVNDSDSNFCFIPDGVYPTQYAELSNLTACMVVNDSDCYHSWNVSVMNCGDFNVAHLKPVPYQYDCGRYCIGMNTVKCKLTEWNCVISMSVLVTNLLFIILLECHCLNIV